MDTYSEQQALKATTEKEHKYNAMKAHTRTWWGVGAQIVLNIYKEAGRAHLVGFSSNIQSQLEQIK